MNFGKGEMTVHLSEHFIYTILRKKSGKFTMFGQVCDRSSVRAVANNANDRIYEIRLHVHPLLNYER